MAGDDELSLFNKPAQVDPAEFERLKQQLDRIEHAIGHIVRVVGPMGVPLPDDTILVQTLWGHKVIVDATDLVMTPQLIVYREWEHDISSLIHDFVGADTTFVDIGANLGYFTCLAGAKIGSGGAGRIVAVEPNPHMISLIKRNIEINWSMAPIQLLEMGASDHEGSVDLILPKDHLANATIAVWGAADADAIQVPVRPLDLALADLARVDLMKIDVEGYERHALRGARDIIARSPDIRILMEWSTGQLAAAGTSPMDMVELFAEMHLATYRLPPSLREFDAAQHRLSETELVGLDYANILLMRAEA